MTSDQERIHYQHHHYGHQAAIIVAHGFFNSKESPLLKELAQTLTSQFDVIAFDFRGHGKSSGLFYWTTKEHQDLETIWKYAKNFYSQIGLIGFSLGAAISIITAAKTIFFNSLIAVSSPTEFGKIEYHFWRMDVENDLFYGILGCGGQGKGARPGPFWLKKEKPVEFVSQLTMPVFYIHGERDWTILPWHSEELYHRTRSYKKLSILKNGPHAEYLIRKNREETLSLVQNWFRETL